MPVNPLDKLLKPRFPSAAVGIEGGSASVVQLERAREGFVIRRAASVDLAAEVVRPHFEETNVSDQDELARALSDLVTSAGLLRQRKFSIALPEASTRSAIITIEGTPTSRREIEEVFEWKIERSFGSPSSELRISREELAPDPQRHKRFLVNAVHLNVLAEYEALFAALGWHAGLILPRHVGEEQWLRNGRQGDGLLLTSHDEGFTAVLVRGSRPVSLRTVFCDASESDDELHRLLLFYRDRGGAAAEATPVERLLVVGDFLNKARVEEIAEDALGVRLKSLEASEVGLLIPSPDLDFDTIAAPAGLARLAW
jgi:hypothetical protein